jgi:ABC-type dipeptide/oligopeptide/nickel transport system permease subunit
MSSTPVDVQRRPVVAWRGAFLVWIIIGAFMTAVALLGALVAPYDPAALTGLSFSPPSADHLFGTDSLGRDVLSRVLAGGRTAVLLAVTSILVAEAIGCTIGLVAGYRRGFVDSVLMRANDVLLAFPALLLVLVLAAGLGPGVTVLVVGVAVVNIPGIARLTRASTLGVVTAGYVESAVTRGESTAAILRREILPNIGPTIVADAGVRFAGAFLIIAGLNFIGIGVQPPAADWATMIAENRSYITLQPWTVVAPTACIALFAISVNIVGEAFARRRSRGAA